MAQQPGARPRQVIADELVGGALHALLDAVDEGLLLLDDTGDLVLVNARFRDLFGLPDMAGLAEIRAGIADCMASPQRYLEAVTAEDEFGGPEDEFELVRPSRRVVRRRVAAVMDPDGRLIGRLVSYRDVTRDVEVSRLKTEFVSNVSHELRTPMAAIKGFLGVVLDDEGSLESEQRRHFLTIAREQTERLSRLIDDLLDISRIEAGRRERLPEPFAAADLVREVSHAVKDQMAAVGLTLVVQPVPPDRLVVADRDQMAQVLLNLLANALKFTPPGGRVELSTGGDEREFWWQVSDTGCGIAGDELDRIFDKFYRCTTVGPAPPGTGLGLAIARELVLGHGGRIDVDSELGAGSRFTVYLPRQGSGLS